MSAQIEIKGNGPVLFVDDDEDFHMILKFLYSRNSKLDNEVVSLFSGIACIEYLEEKYMGENILEHPAMILMDINMPGMDGVETVTKIRGMEMFNKVPIISMLSSSNNPTDIERSMAAGATKYYEKPFEIEKLQFVRID